MKERYKTEKATFELKEKRIEEAAIYLLEHPDSSYTDFVRVFGHKDKWDLQRAQCNIYRKEALKRVGQTSSADIETARRLASASLKNLLKKAMDEEDLGLALKIRMELNKVSGAHAPIRTEVTEKKDESIFKVIPEENGMDTDKNVQEDTGSKE